MTKKQALKIVNECANLIRAWKGYSDGKRIIWTHMQYSQACALLGDEYEPL